MESNFPPHPKSNYLFFLNAKKYGGEDIPDLYQKGREISDEDFDAIAITRDKFHGEWNYMISPTVTLAILP